MSSSVSRLQILFVYVLFFSAVSLLTRLRDIRLKLSVYNWECCSLIGQFCQTSKQTPHVRPRLKRFQNLEKLVISSGLDFDFCVISKDRIQWPKTKVTNLLLKKVKMRRSLLLSTVFLTEETLMPRRNPISIVTKRLEKFGLYKLLLTVFP